MAKQFLLNEFICNECNQHFYVQDTPVLVDYTCPKCGAEQPDDAATVKAEIWRGEDLI